MKRKFQLLALILILNACGSESTDASSHYENNLTNDGLVVDSVLNGEEPELPEYLADLNGVAELDLFVIYETWGEGDYYPVEITRPDGTTESITMSNPFAHIYQYDGSDYDSTVQQTHGVWYIDSLWSISDENVVFEKGTTITGPWMKTAIEKEVYADPSVDSELLYSFKNETYISVIAAWKDWVRVSAYTSEKNILGWCKTRELDDLQN